MSNPHLHGAGHGPGHPHHDEPDEDSGGSDSRWPRRLELIITIALGLAAVVGAFAAYRNEQRNHGATADFSLGVRNFDDSGQYYATANQRFTQDESLFLEYAKAIEANDAKLAQYIFNNLMDDNLRAGVKWWQSPANANSASPARTPFTDKNPNYGIPQFTVAAARTTDSKKNFEAAKHEQDTADHFTLVEVILATALFLYGIAGVTRNMTLKLGTLGTGLTIFIFSVVLLITG